MRVSCSPLVLLGYGLSLLGNGCGGGRVPHRPATTVDRTATAESPPRLVVSIVLDQLPTESMLRWEQALPEAGFLRTAMRDGTYYERARYTYATTMTAPGHAAIYTGQAPRGSGVPSNRRWDPARNKVVSIVDDGEHTIFGRTGAYAGPAILRAPTVGDLLKTASRGEAKVISLSMKDRSAVLSGGAHPDLAVFFDKKTGTFTSSTYYANVIPTWLTAFNEAHPYSQYLERWEPLDAGLLSRFAGRDDAPGEGDWNGLGRVFPHVLASIGEPAETFLATPASAELLFDLATDAIAANELGDDDVTDLLMISVSTTDYIGHVFGPESWESLDGLLRVDARLKHLHDRLSERLDGRVVFALTSDHGVSRLVESINAEGHRAYRIREMILEETAEAALDAALGTEDWIAAYDHPYLYLSETGLRRRAEAIPIIQETFNSMPGVRHAYDPKNTPCTDDPLTQSVCASFTSGFNGALYVLLESGTSIDEELGANAGTSHGTPWVHDTDVPFLVWGPGIRANRIAEPTPQSLVFATLCRLVGVQVP